MTYLNQCHFSLEKDEINLGHDEEELKSLLEAEEELANIWDDNDDDEQKRNANDKVKSNKLRESVGNESQHYIPVPK